MRLLKSIFVITILFALTGSAFAGTELKKMKIFYDAQFGYQARDIGSGQNNADWTHEFNFRRNRFGFIGQLNKMIGFYYQAEYVEDKVIGNISVDDESNSSKSFYTLDAQVRFTFLDWLNVRVGKFKHNLTRENLEGCFTPLTNDRSYFVYAPFHSSRDLGVAVWGNVLDGWLQYRIDAMEGKKKDGTPAPSSNFRYTGRIHVSVFDKEKSYGYKGTYLGKKQVLTIGASAQYEPNAVYDNVTAKTGIHDYLAYSFDIFYEQPTSAGAFTVSAAFLNVSFDGAHKGTDYDIGAVGAYGTRNGFYAKAGWLMPWQIGPGKMQLFARYDYFKYARLLTATGSTNYTVGFAGGGFNYYIMGQALKITGEFSMIDFTYDFIDPLLTDYFTFKLFLQARFQIGLSGKTGAVTADADGEERVNLNAKGSDDSSDDLEGC